MNEMVMVMWRYGQGLLIDFMSVTDELVEAIP